MQHKRRIPHDSFNNSGPSRPLIALGVVFLLLIGGVVTLMTKDIPAPQNPIEKQLDAKAFLTDK